VAKNNGMAGAVAALTVFLLGGVSTFSGLGLIGFMKDRDLFGLGDGGSFGFVLLCVGLLASMAGVLIMRLARNRT
jgi:hypothetical protein